jgi:hypothetical protein
MDTKFQTSFIPKKPILMDQKVTHHSGGTSVFMFISTIIFIISIAGAGFSIVWKDILLKRQQVYIADLKEAENRFDIATIQKLKVASIKIDTATELLKNHLAVSEVFEIISKLTTDGIRFTSFEFSPSSVGTDGTTNNSGGTSIIMRGVGNSFSAIAWQSDVFTKSSKFGTNKVLKNPILSDLKLDPMNGSVEFRLTASIGVQDINYEKILVGDVSTPATSTNTQ